MPWNGTPRNPDCTGMIHDAKIISPFGGSVKRFAVKVTSVVGNFYQQG
jgi:hypothetical protein